jgi:transcriptional regulator with XRE-family HTH domain
MPPRKDPQPALGAAVRELRQKADLSQETVAGIAGVHPTWLSRIEAGSANPAWGTVVRIAAGIGVSMSEVAAAEARLREADTP